MSAGRLITRYYALTAFIVGGFALLGYATSRLVIQLTSNPGETRRAVFYARLVDELDHADHVHGITRLSEVDRVSPISLALVDENGVVLYPRGFELPFAWASASKPQNSYEDQPVGTSTERRALVRLGGAPVQYLYVGLPPRRGSGPFLMTFGIFLASVLLGIAFAMFQLFRVVREKAALADGVIAELQRGNLKARFPIRKMDELGQAMSRFNRMADEIERLIVQLRTVEQSRMSLLQELAHDLRTPVSSLRNLLETLQSRRSQMTDELREEFLGLALTEVDYFQRLVEDLLLLAQVSEPSYRSESHSVDLSGLLEEEAENLRGQFGTKKIEIRKRLPPDPVLIQGDSHLLRRMIRNVLNNAYSFATSEVALTLERGPGGTVIVRVEDDGPGFSEQALREYGERRATRVLAEQRGERLSVGLGSVIIKAVAEIHRGKVQPENRGSPTGARVSLSFPVTA